ncbi:MAG: protein kinase [Burkholderiaceae bacterium]|nr:protein kinase [Burkholderiaceae bacterium]
MPAAHAPDASALPPGHRVLEYRIEKTLGGGGFGITYLAHDINLDLPVALKEYFPNDLAVRGAGHSVSMRVGDSQEQYTWGLERFLDEARALATFRHTNIVRVLRYFKENGTAYIVMEYESGDPLKRWLARQTSFDQKGLLKVIYPLLDGLESVHKAGFLHRDIKPDNIYIRADGTPVLLDFGAARRVTANTDLTNVVSPGFAPFEQYHSRGNQGPWTDIYSLGAVMYWMTTGSKPMESASRVKEDTMRTAVDSANVLGYGEMLLRAIDWAMAPDEAKRPQSVAEFRKALTGSEDNTTVVTGEPTSALQRAPRQSPAGNSIPASGLSASQSAAHPDSLRRNVMATLMFLDLVGYSAHSVTQQVLLKTRFNELLTKTLRGIEESSRIIMDTGDGAAICFLGDPEEALQSALLMRDLVLQKYRGSMMLRLGLHMGPVRVLFDINERVNVVGDGINVAQRIMDFAQANQIVVSRAYYDVISRITDNTANMFRHLGPHLDKHLRSHDIYAVVDPQSQPALPRTRPTEFDHTAPHRAVTSTLTPQIAAEIENDLARLIGPLARVLVKKAVFRANSAQALRELLAMSIPDTAAREGFVNPKLANSRASGNSVSRPLSHPLSQPLSRTSPSQAPSSSLPGGDADPSQPVTSQRRQEVTPEHLAQFERALSQHIGPMAKMIVRKEAGRYPGYEDLLKALALHLDKQEERQKFLTTHRTPSRG